MANPVFRFSLIHNVLGTKIISEPDGWKGATLKLDRHVDFHSLVEYFEGDFIFYGNNGVDDGGADFIRTCESTYGFDTNIRILIEVSVDEGVSYSTVFDGLLQLRLLKELQDNKIQVPIVRNDFWNKFISRFDTPVNIRSATDLDGNAVSIIGLSDIELPSQKIRKSFDGELSIGRAFHEDDLPLNSYIQLDFDRETLSEIDEKYNLPLLPNTEVPQSLYDIAEDGDYTINVRVELSHKDYAAAPSGCSGFFVNTDPTSAYISVKIQINDTAINFTSTDHIGQSTSYTYSGVHNLKIGDQIRIYAKVDSVAFKAAQSIDNILLWGTDNTLVDITLGNFSFNGISCDVNTTFLTTRNFGTAPSGVIKPTYLTITGNTTFRQTEAQSYLIHDAAYSVAKRICTSGVYSSFFGATTTNARSYASDGCGWTYVLATGLNIRGYTFDEKPFFMSFKDWWDGANPIFNLGLGYDTISNEDVIRIEEKDYFYDRDNVSINFDNAYVFREYDEESIFQKIEIGYRKWQSENIAGLDDPQTKHTYATIVKGRSVTLYSNFVAASLAIEATRRQTIEQSKDYKFDNDTFIISIDGVIVSPDRYQPELDEDFDSITNLNNSDARYNLILTPMRNLLRWGNYFNGCLQKYLTSSYKFVSGEGNYDMVSDYSCASGDICKSIICDPLAESQDISLATYGNTLGYIHLPHLYTVEEINLSLEDYLTIRNNRNKCIGISQTQTNHKKFFIKELTYNIYESKCKIVAWPLEEMPILVIESEQPTHQSDFAGAPDANDAEAAYQEVLDYADSQGYTAPSEEVQELQITVISQLKANGIWDQLDLLYIFSGDGDDNFATLNLVDPTTFKATRVNSILFIPNTGFIGGGNGYLNTGWDVDNNAVHFTQNDGSYFLYNYNDKASAVQVDVGARNASTTNNIRLLLKNAIGQIAAGVHSAAANFGAIASTIGFFHAQRTASNAQRIYKDASQIGSTDTTASNPTPGTNDLFLLADNSNGSPLDYSLGQIGIFGIGASLTGKESQVYNVFSQYITAVAALPAGIFLLEDGTSYLLLENDDLLIKEN